MEERQAAVDADERKEGVKVEEGGEKRDYFSAGQ